jgi:hypothetical protein
MLYFRSYTPVPWLDILVLVNFWSWLRNVSTGRICMVLLKSLCVHVLFVLQTRGVLYVPLVCFNLLRTRVDLSSMSPWILWHSSLLLCVALIVYLRLLIVLVDLWDLYLVWLLLLLRILLCCFLSTGYAVMECLVRLYVTVMCGFRVVFGRLCVPLCSVVLLCRPHITHRQMVCLRGFIDL